MGAIARAVIGSASLIACAVTRAVVLAILGLLACGIGSAAADGSTAFIAQSITIGIANSMLRLLR